MQNPSEMSAELEQAALVKVYEGILGLRAAKKFKKQAQADSKESGGEDAASLEEATANLIKAFEAAGKS